MHRSVGCSLPMAETGDAPAATTTAAASASAAATSTAAVAAATATTTAATTATSAATAAAAAAAAAAATATKTSAMASAPDGCDVWCHHGGRNETCRGRVQRSALHDFPGGGPACAKAHTKVQQECPVCILCRREDVRCGRYDCEQGLPDQGTSWPRDKRTWCCAHAGLGCDRSSSTATTTSGPEAYDCGKGYWNFQTSWSEGKKAWCCEHEHRACPADGVTALLTAAAASGALSFDTVAHDRDNACSASAPAAEGARVGWLLERQRCCEDRRDPRRWSRRKREWCCVRVQRGCPTVSHQHPHDCQDGRPHWNPNWTEQKRSWCCQAEGVGCAPRNCREDLPDSARLWCEEKQDWCCKHERLGCPGGPGGQSDHRHTTSRAGSVAVHPDEDLQEKAAWRSRARGLLPQSGAAYVLAASLATALASLAFALAQLAARWTSHCWIPQRHRYMEVRSVEGRALSALE